MSFATALRDLLRRPGKAASYAPAGAALATGTAVAGFAGETLAAPADHGGAHAAAQQQTTRLIYGEDISNHQPDHDWQASPAQFGIIKATEGTDFRDATFARHWAELAKKGIVRGAYHFAHPANDPIWAWVGSSAVASIAPVIKAMDKSIIRNRPYRSPMYPKNRAPRGRMR